MRLGTTQKNTDSGSIFHESVAEVLLVGNIRERCGVFWNFFVNSSQRYNVFAQLLQYTDKAHNCLQQERHSFTTPPCINVARFDQIRNPAALGCAHSNTTARNLSLLKRYIGFLPGKTRKECRFARKEDLQQRYALRLDSILPRLSEREIYFQATTCGSRNGPKQCGETCTWKTGHMTWEMHNGSAFAQEARKRQESTLAGPSGHTYSLLNAMKILNNFDLEKWILLCVVWLVGSDHHSIYEVIAGANFHGMQVYANMNSIQIVEHMLWKLR